MKKAKITFFCTGMCGESHPVHKHCKECSHALFKMRLGGLSVYYSPLFGCSFYSRGKIFYPPEGSYLWKVADEVVEFADRCFKRWGKR
jgi:hypothetical protein